MPLGKILDENPDPTKTIFTKKFEKKNKYQNCDESIVANLFELQMLRSLMNRGGPWQNQ